MRLICAIFMLAASLEAQPVKNDFSCIIGPGNPSIALWKRMREALEAKDGDTYAANIKGAELPRFPATILAMNGDEYLVSIADGKTPDVVIRLTGFWKGNALRIGTELEFVGISESLMKEPLRLVIAVDPENMVVIEKSSRICTKEELQKARKR